MKQSDIQEGFKLFNDLHAPIKPYIGLEELAKCQAAKDALLQWSYEHLGELIEENQKLKEALLKERAVHVMPYAIYEDLEEEEWEKAKKEARRLLRAEGWDL